MIENKNLVLIPTNVKEAALAWEKAGLARRLEVLQQAGRLLESKRDKLNQILRAEGMSLELARDYAEWVIYAANPELLAKYSANMAQWVQNATGGEILVRRADGVVLIFAQAGSPTFNAAPLFSILLAGNGAIIIRSPFADAGVRFIAEEILQTVLEKNLFSKDIVKVVTEKYREAMYDFIASKEVKTVLSIGSSLDNNNIAQQAHEHGKKVILEHYGRGCMVVWSDASIDKAVNSTRRAFDLSTRPCFIPKHILVHQAVFEKYINKLLEVIPRYSKTVEHDQIEGVLTPTAQMEGYLSALEEAKNFGEIHFGGYQMDAQGRPSQNGTYAAATIISLNYENLSKPIQCVDQELFFPLIPIIVFSGTDEEIACKMSKVIEKEPVGLRTSIWTNMTNIIEHFVKEISSVSLLRINNDHSQCPLYASFWGGGNGDNHLFWAKTSHLQAIDCNNLNKQEIKAVLQALGITHLDSAIFQTTTIESEAKDKISVQVISQENSQLPTISQYLDLPGVSYQLKQTIAKIEFNRPKKHNSLDSTIRDSLYEITSRLMDLEDLRCVIITGAGKSFCSGADLKDLTSFTPEQAKDYMIKVTWSFRRLEQLSVPVLAAVKGYCMGGGFELILHCDEVIASEDTVFCFPETGIGILTTTGAIARLSSIVGMMQAKQLLMGKKIDATEAWRIGLVSQVVSSNYLDQAVEQRALELLKQPSEGLAALKKIVYQSQAENTNNSWIAELEAFESLSKGPWQRFVKEHLKKNQ